MSNLTLTSSIMNGLGIVSALDNFDLETITTHLTMMEAAGLKRPTLQDLQTLKLESSWSPGWPAHYVYMTGMGILALMVLGALGYGSFMYYLV
jgi:hypothetical protein